MSFASTFLNDDNESNSHNDVLAGDFVRSFVESHTYPENLVLPNKPDYQLIGCREQLNDNEDDLFGYKNNVTIIDIRHEYQDHRIYRITQTSELETIGIHTEMRSKDPECRLIFLSAPNSRDRLTIERPLFSKILTWHQVMPQFVDFALAFGVAEHAKDFLYSGFRAETSLDHDSNKLRLESLGRSGWEVRMCHILRSMERIKGKWPWALRPTATYHSFDVKTGKSVWIVVKANNLIENRAQGSIRDNDLYKSGLDNSFESTLGTHLVLCAWAAENWRWYINFVEQRVQELSRDALNDQTHSSESSFEDLQNVHFVEEKANEALLVLRSNTAVIQELSQFYSDVEGPINAVCPKSPSSVIAKFKKLLDATVRDLVMQQARAEMLLKLLADRKSLLATMLEWKNAQVNLDLAQKSQNSAAKMESMTKAMHTLASETKMEAANMRIITLVTLFFLPGTFVSVSVTLGLVTALKLTSNKTLMSTPIVHYPDDQQVINHEALYLFLVIALPLLTVTLMTWYGLYCWHQIRRGEHESQSRFIRWLSTLLYKDKEKQALHLQGDSKV